MLFLRNRANMRAKVLFSLGIVTDLIVISHHLVDHWDFVREKLVPRLYYRCIAVPLTSSAHRLIAPSGQWLCGALFNCSCGVTHDGTGKSGWSSAQLGLTSSPLPLCS